MNDEINNQEPEEDEGSQHNFGKQLNPTIPPVTAAFFGLFAVFLLYQVGGSLLTLAIFGLHMENADVNALRLLTMGGQILLILLPALVLTKLIYEDVTTVLRVKIPNWREVLVFVIGLFILTPLMQNVLFLQNYFFQKLAQSSPLVHQIQGMFDQLDQLVEKTYGSLLETHNVFEGSFIIFVVAVTPALCEETFFRGFVQKSFEQKWGTVLSIFITAIFFGLYHFNPYGLVALIMLGAYFGFAAYTSNSIFIPMVLHFTNNLVAVIAYFVLGSEELINTDVTGNENISTAVISLIVLSVIFSAFVYLLKKNYHKIASN